MEKLISRRSFVAGAAAAGAAAVLAGCNSGGSGNAGSKSYKIGVLQLTEHAALDASHKGFVEALNEAGISYTLDDQNAQNDQSACQTIATTLVNNGSDLIFAIATPAAQAVAGATTEIPVVGTAITDFVGAGLVDTDAKPGTNVTGSSDLTPVKEQIDMLHTVLPNAKRVGLLYCSAETNSVIQIEMAEAQCDAIGLAHERYTVSSSNEIQSVVESMNGKVDAIYAPTDNTIAAGMTTVAMVADEIKIPVICGEENMVTAGGLCSLSINYQSLGKVAGKMAVKILTEGAKPKDMPIEYTPANELQVIKNDEKAKLLGIDLSVI